MSEPKQVPDATDIPPVPDAPMSRPAALDRPPATWEEAAELAHWAEREGPPPPADDEMSSLTDLSHGSWFDPSPLSGGRELPSGWWVLPAAATAAVFWWAALGWLFH